MSEGSARAIAMRSGLVEAIHEAAVAVVDTSSDLVARAGDVERVFFMRSSAKPFQAAVALQCGADLTPEQTAIACSSHDGDPIHVAIVRSMLGEVGLAEGSLQCPPDRPISMRANLSRAAHGDHHPRRILHNCSGKHAAMLRAVRAQDWDLATYLDPAHPLQQRILREMRTVGALVEVPVGVDGCGAPCFPVTALTIARSFAYLANDAAYADIRSAMHRFPALVSGVGNADAIVATDLHAVAKRGAEGAMGVAVFGFGAIAIKIWDGGSRAMGAVLSAVLTELGWVPHGAADRLGTKLATSVLGGGRPVGAVEGRVQFGTRR